MLSPTDYPTADIFTLADCISIRDWWKEGKELLLRFVIVFIAGESTIMKISEILL